MKTAAYSPTLPSAVDPVGAKNVKDYTNLIRVYFTLFYGRSHRYNTRSVFPYPVIEMIRFFRFWGDYA